MIRMSSIVTHLVITLSYALTKFVESLQYVNLPHYQPLYESTLVVNHSCVKSPNLCFKRQFEYFGAFSIISKQSLTSEHFP